jgi:hypothetical protein
MSPQTLESLASQHVCHLPTLPPEYPRRKRNEGAAKAT